MMSCVYSCRADKVKSLRRYAAALRLRTHCCLVFLAAAAHSVVGSYSMKGGVEVVLVCEFTVNYVF